MKLFNHILLISSIFFSLACSTTYKSRSIAQSSSNITHVIGDIEGINNRWEKLVTDNVIKLGERSTIEQTNKNNSLAFLGDLARRGPHGVESVERVIELKSVNPNTISIIGNHDGNWLGFLSLNAALEMGLIEAYQDWLELKGAQNNLTNRVNWWAERMGLQDKVRNFWIEMAARELGIKSTEAAERFSGDTQFEKLNEVLNENKMAEQFLKSVKPGGVNFEFLKISSLLEVKELDNGKKSLFFHSGRLSPGNLGVIPGGNDKMYNKHSDSTWLQKWANGLNHWKNTELDNLSNELERFEELKKEGKVTEARSLAIEISKNRLATYMDVGFDFSLNKMTFDANSLVYPDNVKGTDNKLPSLTNQFVSDILAKAGVSYVFGGHEPVGDLALAKLGFSEKHNHLIRYIMTDTSFSPVESTDKVQLHSDGTLEIEGKTRDGKGIFTIIPPESSLEADLKSTDENRKFRAEQIKKIGMTVNGYLVVGFEITTNKSGIQVPNFENMVVVKQEGYNFNYKTIDRWGLEGVKPKYFTTDFESIYEDAKNEKSEILKSYNKVEMAESDFLKFVEGKKIIINSGPALNSLSPVLDKATGQPKNVEQYLKYWKAELRSIGLNDKVVILGGGTEGLEAMKNEIVDKINKDRIAKGGTPISMIGAITGITGGNELDKNVKRFLITKAFYWEDYFREVLKLVDKSKAKSVSIRFGGGGGIVTQQIQEAFEFLEKTKHRAQVYLEQGITRVDALSATDKAISEVKEGLVKSERTHIVTQKFMKNYVKKAANVRRSMVNSRKGKSKSVNIDKAVKAGKR